MRANGPAASTRVLTPSSPILMKMLLPAAAFAVLGLAACRTEPAVAPGTDTTASATPAGTMADSSFSATLASQGGSTVTGQVTFTQEAGGVRVVATVTGLTPGDHGFHVHAGTSCDAADLPDDPDTDPNPAGAAGPHFAGADSVHGAHDAARRHDGDLGNLTADASGTATYDRLDTRLRLSGDNSIAGRAVIVHAKADDLTSQPAGAAGAREACGLVQPVAMGVAM